jgi:hypothetical protein
MCTDKSGLACFLYCIKSGWRCILYLSFSAALACNLHSPLTNGMLGSIPEEMSQTLLTNKNQENLD